MGSSPDPGSATGHLVQYGHLIMFFCSNMGKRQIFQRGALAMAVLLCLRDPSVLGTAGNKMNVLFLVADDMRPELGCLRWPRRSKSCSS